MEKILTFVKGINKKVWIIGACAVLVLSMAAIILFCMIPAPKILINGERDITLPVFEQYNDAGASVMINNEQQDGIIIENNVKTDTVGSYTVVYKFTHGKKTYTATRNIHIVDNVAPQITLNGASEVTVSALHLYKEESAVVTDNYDTEIASKLETAQKQNEDGSYEVRYSVKDASGNSAEAVRRIIIKDIVAPAITLNGGKSVVLLLGDTYTESGFSANDDLDGNITSRVTVTGGVNTAIRGANYLTYSVTDNAGNHTSVTRKVMVYSPEDVAANRVCLTFDDGPSSKVTTRILDILKANNVKATFFICDYSADELPIIKRMVDEGHTIGIHGYSHVYRDIYASEEAFMNNVYTLRDKLKNDTGYVATVIRFPGGSSNTASAFNKGVMTRLTKLVEERGFRYFDWNVSSGDAKSGTASSTKIYNNVIGGLRHGRTNMVLMHDIASKTTTADALQNIINYGKANGYSFCEINDLTPDIHHGVNN